jgi:hypothetical protein
MVGISVTQLASNITHMNTKANKASKIENNAFVFYGDYNFPFFL